MSGLYRIYAEGTGVSLERNTETVPDDDRYYLVKNGEIIGSFSSKKEGIAHFRRLLKEIGYKPPVCDEEKIDLFEESLDKFFRAKEIYWAESHKYREKGGKGR